MAEETVTTTAAVTTEPAAIATTAAVAPTPWDGLTPEDKGFVDLHRFEKPMDLVKAHRELLSLRGVPADQLLKLPSKDAKPEEWNSVYSRLGWPDKPEGYDTSKIAVAQEQGGNPELVKAMMPVLHGAHLSQTQAEAVAAGWNTYQQAEAKKVGEELAQQSQADLADLQKTWGSGYEERLELARRAARKHGISAEEQDSLEAAIGLRRTLEFLSDVGQNYKEADFVSGDGARHFGMTPEMALEQIKQHQQDREWSKRYTDNPGGPEGQQLDRLQRIAVSGRKAA